MQSFPTVLHLPQNLLSLVFLIAVLSGVRWYFSSLCFSGYSCVFFCEWLFAFTVHVKWGYHLGYWVFRAPCVFCMLTHVPQMSGWQTFYLTLYTLLTVSFVLSLLVQCSVICLSVFLYFGGFIQRSITHSIVQKYFSQISSDSSIVLDLNTQVCNPF